MDRVKGVLSRTCRGCGGEASGQRQDDGGITYRCANCDDQPADRQVASDQPSDAPVERVTGTDVPEEDR